MCEEPHLADNPAQHSTASVQISSHIGSSSTMDYSQPDGEPTSARGYRPSSKLQGAWWTYLRTRSPCFIQRFNTWIWVRSPVHRHFPRYPTNKPVARKTLMHYPAYESDHAGTARLTLRMRLPSPRRQVLLHHLFPFLNGGTTNKLSLTTMPFRVLCFTTMRVLLVAET